MPFTGSLIELVLYAAAALVTVVYFWQVLAPRFRRERPDSSADERTEALLQQYEQRRAKLSADEGDADSRNAGKSTESGDL